MLSFLASLLGLLLAVAGLLLAGLSVQLNSGALVNGLFLGIPALVLGPAGYFVSRSHTASARDNTTTTTAASWLGVAATVAGATTTLILLVVELELIFGPPPS